VNVECHTFGASHVGDQGFADLFLNLMSSKSANDTLMSMILLGCC